MDISSVPVDFWITLATILVTLFLGQISKKYEIVAKKQIPLQNLCIGIVVCLIECAITGNFNTALALSGLMSGGLYDAGKAVKLVLSGEEEK